MFVKGLEIFFDGAGYYKFDQGRLPPGTCWLSVISGLTEYMVSLWSMTPVSFSHSSVNTCLHWESSTVTHVAYFLSFVDVSLATAATIHVLPATGISQGTNDKCMPS